VFVCCGGLILASAKLMSARDVYGQRSGSYPERYLIGRTVACDTNPAVKDFTRTDRERLNGENDRKYRPGSTAIIGKSGLWVLK